MKKLTILCFSIMLMLFSVFTIRVQATTVEQDIPTPLLVCSEGSLYGTKSILLEWEVCGTDVHMTITKAEKKEGPYEAFLTFIPTETLSGSLSDETVKLGKTYYYNMEAKNVLTGQTENKVIQVKSILGTPTIESVKQDKNKTAATLKWNKIKSATGYQVYRSTQADRGYKKIKTLGKTTNYTDKEVKAGKTYYYKVRAIKKNNSAVKSKYAQPALLCMKPTKPSVTGEYKDKKVLLSWKKVKGAQGYYVYKKNKKGKYTKINVTDELSYEDGDVKKNTEYAYKVAAYYINGEKQYVSGKSNACKVYTSSIDPKKKMIALTFDDGPGPYTKEIVDCLKKNKAKATFFVVGNRVNAYKSTLKYTYEAGNEIANHSYDHTILTTISGSSVKWQMDATDKVIKKVIGEKTSIVRTPGGAVNRTVKNKVGKPIIFWSIDTLDWKTRSKSKTINSVLNNVEDGDIILMHDIHKPTKEAALYLIPKLKKMGYQLVTVSELAKYRAYKMKNGTVYSRFSKK